MTARTRRAWAAVAAGCLCDALVELHRGHLWTARLLRLEAEERAELALERCGRKGER